MDRLDLLVLDADGVILDTPHELAWREAAGDLLRSAVAAGEPAAAALPDRFYPDHVAGRNRMAGAQAILALLGLAPAPGLAETLAARKQAIFLREVEAGNWRVFPDAVALLAGAAASGLPVAVATSSANAKELLDRHLAARTKLRAALIMVAAPGTDGEASKRHLVAQVLRGTGADPARTVFIDDSPDSLRQTAGLGVNRIHLERTGDSRVSGLPVFSSLSELHLRRESHEVRACK